MKILDSLFFAKRFGEPYLEVEEMMFDSSYYVLIFYYWRGRYYIETSKTLKEGNFIELPKRVWKKYRYKKIF